MEEIYDGIHIVVTARRLENGKWVADAFFNITPDGGRIVSQVPLRQYATGQEAERFAMAQAKRMLSRQESVSN